MWMLVGKGVRGSDLVFFYVWTRFFGSLEVWDGLPVSLQRHRPVN